MIAKLKRHFRNFPFRTKIISISLLSGMVPLLLLTMIAALIINSNLTKNEQNKNDEYLSAASIQLDTKLSTFNDAMNYLINNQQLVRGLSLETISNYNLYNFYSNDLVPLFNSIQDQHSDIQNITLYTSEDIYNHGNYVKQIVTNDVTAHFKANKTIKPQYYFDKDNQKLYSYIQIFSTDSQKMNFLVFQLDYDKLFHDLENLSQGRFKVTISDPQTTIYQYSTLKTASPFPILGRLWDRFDMGDVTGTKPLLNHWQLQFSKPKQDIYLVTVLVFAAAFGVLLLLIFLIFTSTRILSKTVVGPIDALVSEMTSIKDGQMSLNYMYEAEDEIGQLYKSYDGMLKQIKQLIEEVYNSEIKQQKLEMQALQAQINPHFFYNSLSLINNKAILTKNKEISEMAQLLSNYYRLSLNQGKNIISVAKELDLTVTYAKIQQRMHNFSFDLMIDIDPSVNDSEMINLLLQPFVENAIFHGIDHIEADRKGVLAIRAEKIKDQLIFEIFDNGAGMEPEKAAQIFSSQGKHYGVQNVLKRVQLYYGDSGKITLFSYPNEGTFVQLLLPAKNQPTMQR